MTDRYEAYNRLNGKSITGLVDWIPGKAGIMEDSWHLSDHGTLTFEYEGDTDLYWDGRSTETEAGFHVYEDEEGELVDERDLVLINIETGWYLTFEAKTVRCRFNDPDKMKRLMVAVERTITAQKDCLLDLNIIYDEIRGG